MKGFTTVRVTEVPGRQFRFEGRRVHYCPASLMGTVSESHAISMAAGQLYARAPGDWPVRETAHRDICTRPEFAGVRNH